MVCAWGAIVGESRIFTNESRICMPRSLHVPTCRKFIEGSVTHFGLQIRVESPHLGDQLEKGFRCGLGLGGGAGLILQCSR